MDSKPLILLVNINEQDQHILSHQFEVNNIDCIAVSEGKDIAKLVKEFTPDLIVIESDTVLHNEFLIYELINSNTGLVEILLIVIPSTSDYKTIEKLFKIGVSDVIIKPYDVQIIIHKIKNLIRQRNKLNLINEKYLAAISERNELQTSNGNRDKFFSIIAHDLKGAFSSFKGLSQILFEEYDELNKEEIIQIIRNLNKSSNRLYDFLENLLEWSKVQMGRVECYIEEIELNTLVSQSIAIYSDAIEEKDISIEYNLPPNIKVIADKDMLSSILRNLISNSIKFTKQFGTIKIKNGNEQNGFVSLHISDSGVGIHKDDLKKLFRVDKKYSNPGTNNEQGTGLGLILCKELIEMLGGSISVESQYKIGSTFTINLPVPSLKNESSKILIQQ